MRGLGASQIPIVADGVNSDHGRGYFPGNIAALQILQPEPVGFQQKLEMVAVAGELASPSASLSKRLFGQAEQGAV